MTATIVRTARLAHLVAAVSVVLLVFVQVYLIAMCVFGDAGALDAHKATGHVAEGLELAVLLTAAVGWWGDWPLVRMSAALAVVGGLQASFARDLGTSPAVHGLHGLLAIAVVLLASLIVMRAWGRVVARPRHALR